MLNRFDFNMIISWGLLIVISLFVIIISYLFMSMYCNRVLKLLTGGR